ncbi:EAL domain-containing protein [Pseudomonas chlororaphis]|uniref:cyclic-guanylate-specific phosphodiesterase n=1 Tax=Pseudomonas chlororaphis TaxID=587753 RepID=A0A1Q8EMQ4_9PSED|nr:EAL domain-containing protein [Pseudomonas chlororaphis]OLF53082.1 signal transduction protein [Pseudomonas chlororaphis]
MIAAYKALFGRKTLVLCATVAMGSVAWLCAGSFAEHLIEQQLKRTQERWVEPRTQIDQALATLGSIDRSTQECSAEQYAKMAEQVEKSRFIYQAAVRLDNGKLCSSYGQEITSLSIESASDLASVKGRTYAVSSAQKVSADRDFIMVSEPSRYVWINKKALRDHLNIAQDVQWQLRGPDGVALIASTSPLPAKVQEPLPLEALVTSTDNAYVAYRDNRNELTSVISLPLSALTALRWKLFIALAFMFEVLLYSAWKMNRHYASGVIQLREAIRANALEIHYQPIVDLRTGNLVGAQTLSRWSAKGVAIPAEAFVAAAARPELIRLLTRSVISRVAEDYSTYLWACKDFYITIDLCAQDILDRTFPDFVASVTATYNIPASAIVFAISEKALPDQKSAALQLHRLRAGGHRIAIDDLGTGYASFSLTESVPVDILKIDRSFIEHTNGAPQGARWRHVAKRVRSLHFKGIEAPQLLPRLVSESGLLAQGWLFSKALPVHALARRYFQCSVGVNPYAD